jgi:nitrogen fixation protein FixH
MNPASSSPFQTGRDRTPAPATQTSTRTFNPWPVAIVATFVVFISGTIGLIILSAKDRNDLVAADYYEQEIQYQSRLDQLERTAPFSASIAAVYDAAHERLTLSLPPQHAAAGASGEVQLYRPNHSGADQSFPIATSAEGVQYLPATDLPSGLWKVRLHWKVADQEFFADRQVVVRPELRP